MEVISKIIKQAVTTGITYNNTGGTEYIIIPDLNAIYHMKVALNGKMFDYGFFDALVTGDTVSDNNNIIEKTIPFVITGTFLNGDTIKTVNESIVIGNGNDTISEFGVLFTIDPQYNDENNLTYENVSLGNVNASKNVRTPPSIPYEYNSKILVQVVEPTNLYYRAYVINSQGIGYGQIKTGIVTLIELVTTTTTTLSVSGGGSGGDVIEDDDVIEGSGTGEGDITSEQPSDEFQ